ncbi:MAG: alpha/beta hydrolase [Actinomycetota bacterium]
MGSDHVVLVHGWGGSFEATWQRNGFSALLEDGGKTVVGVDLLGHGTAPKPHDPDAYADLTTRVVDALPDAPAAAVGFSLGALTLLRTAIEHPDRFERLVVAGVGANIFAEDHSGAAHISEGLDALLAGGELGELSQQQRLFAQYGQQPGNDLEALGAIMRRPRGSELSHETLSTITCPVLVVVGEDDFVHPADELVDALGDARLVNLPRTDHFATTDSFGFYDAALEFLGAI